MTQASRKSRWLRSLIAPGVVLALLAGVAAWYFWPRTDRFFTDGQTVWPAAPGQAAVRSVLWAPGKALDEPVNSSRADYQPRLSPDGAELYFTRGMAGANSDIYVARRTATGWSNPTPLAEVNTGHDEIGPSLSSDGRQLAFYSNRPGGFGGYDIYVATRADDGTWGVPANIGPAINGPANEYDPAFSPDGRSLLFSSNRNSASSGPWSGTLRERREAGQYDLFIADLDKAGLASNVRELASLNTAHNEGQPTFSPDGQFVYFASDRPGGQGGFDLYRSRVQDLAAARFEKPENLGQPINTPANEMDPAVSIEGFAIYFSSDRAPVSVARQGEIAATQPESDYNLYYSPSREVVPFAVTTRRDIAAVWRTISWPLVGLILSMIALAFLISLAFDRRRRPSVIATCLLISVMLHLLGLVGATYYQIRQRLAGLNQTAAAQHVDIELAQPGSDELTARLRAQVSELRQQAEHIKSPDRLASPDLPGAPRLEPCPPVELSQAEPAVAEPERVEPQIEPAQSPVQVQPAEAPKIEPMAPQELAALNPRDMDRPADRTVEAGLPSPAQPAEPERVLITPPDAPPSRPVVQLAPRQAEAPRPRASAPEPVTPIAPSPAQPASEPAKAAPAQMVPAEPSANVQLAEQRLAEPPTAPSEPVPTGSLAVERAPTSDQRVARAKDRPVVSVETKSAEPVAPTAGPRPVVTTDAPDRPADSPAASPADARPAQPAADLLAKSLAPESPSLPRDVADTSVKPDSPIVQVAPLPAEHADVSAPPRPQAGKPASSSAPRAAPQPAAPADLDRRLAESTPLRPAGVELPRPASSTDSVAESNALPFESRPTALTPAAPPEPATVRTAPQPASSGGQHELAAPVRVAGEAARPISRPTVGVSTTRPAEPMVALAGPAAMTMTAPPRLPAAPSEPPAGPSGAADAANKLSPLALADAEPVKIAPAETVYKLRTEADKQAIIEQLGGSKETEQAVKDALAYLARVQNRDGSWPTGTKRSDVVGVTGLAVLAFLGSGQTHKSDGPHREAVARAVEFLRKSVAADGDMRSGGQMYSQGIGAMALCEAYSMTRDEALKEPARKAVQFIIDAQTPGAGWRYQPRVDSDTSVLGWQLMAIRSGQIAGFELNTKAAWQGAEDWLKRVGTGTHGGVYHYQPGASGRDPTAMTAEGLFCRQILKSPADAARTKESVDYLLARMPQTGRRRDAAHNFYYWYYGTAALHGEGGAAWDKWNAAMSKLLVELQAKSGQAKGSWGPEGKYDQVGGPVYTTALGAMALEVYYRYLPFYKSAAE